MSDPARVMLAGATGLIGAAVLREVVGRPDIRLTVLARREVPLPPGIRVEVFVADPERWGEVMDAVRPSALISALGTTWRKAGRDEAAFRAVDHDLVLDVARMARAAGIARMVTVSSAGAELGSGNRYLRVKGETERDLAKVGFTRLDILRPGLLKGKRADDPRPAERIAAMLSPLTDLAMQGRFVQFRSIPAQVVARAALALALRMVRGRYTHDNAAIHRAARS